MELQWNHSTCRYLKTNIRQVLNQEQTQEVRLSDGMPDIGRVLCAWGQCIVRSKEWRNDSMSVSGGVTAWVLYAPEDGSEPRSVEVWLPFQGKWNFSDSQREGTIQVSCLLRGLDARTLSARKIMVRATVGILGQAMEPAEAAVYGPDELPEGVQVRKKTYPAHLPAEAGEKLFALEEELPLSGETPRKIMACDVQPVVTEQAAMGSRVIMRGIGRVHLVYMGQDDRLHSGYYDLPFAQFSDLDRDYDKDATAAVTMAVSGMDAEISEDHVRVKCTLLAQYVIFERAVLEVAEDAYAPLRAVTPTVEALSLPMLLERRGENVDAAQETAAQASQIVDTVLLMDHPTQYREGNTAVMELPGVFQVLYYDADGNLQTRQEAWHGRLELPACPDCDIAAQVSQMRAAECTAQGDRLRLGGSIAVEVQTSAREQIPMVTALEVGEQRQPDPERPSLILRRLEQEDLWELAKLCGSTVDAIRKANQLADDPAPGQMLLIPVY